MEPPVTHPLLRKKPNKTKSTKGAGSLLGGESYGGPRETQGLNPPGEYYFPRVASEAPKAEELDSSRQHAYLIARCS